MNFQTIKSCGDLGFEFQDIMGNGEIVTKDLITKLINNIVKRSTKYYDEMQGLDHSFIYGEKQFHSIVCPSIADITTKYLMEHPLKRKPRGEEEYNGFADYWIEYRDYNFLLEIKESFFAYKRLNKPNQRIAIDFSECKKQLNHINREQCRSLTESKGLIKIALSVIPFYQGSANLIDKKDIINQDFYEIFSKLLKNIKSKNESNFQALWVLNERLLKPIEYLHRYEIYPAVAFVGYVSEMIS